MGLFSSVRECWSALMVLLVGILLMHSAYREVSSSNFRSNCAKCDTCDTRELRSGQEPKPVSPVAAQARPQRMSHCSVAFAVFTSSATKHRYEAVVDTWGQRVQAGCTTRNFIAAGSNMQPDVQGRLLVPNCTEDRSEGLCCKSLFLWKEMWARFGDNGTDLPLGHGPLKWFSMWGDDHYVFGHNLAIELEALDHSVPLFVGKMLVGYMSGGAGATFSLGAMRVLQATSNGQPRIDSLAKFCKGSYDDLAISAVARSNGITEKQLPHLFVENPMFYFLAHSARFSNRHWPHFYGDLRDPNLSTRPLAFHHCIAGCMYIVDYLAFLDVGARPMPRATVKLPSFDSTSDPLYPM